MLRWPPTDPIFPMPAGLGRHGQQDGHADAQHQTQEDGERHARPHAAISTAAARTAFFDADRPAKSARHVLLRLV